MKSSVSHIFGTLQKRLLTTKRKTPRNRDGEQTVEVGAGLPALDYEPLSTKTSIRLLTLDPGAGDEPIVCRLHEVELDKEPKYEALSYCWGDPTQRSTIIVNDSAFQATSNLKSALKHLRLPPDDGLRVLWVDAVCINQADLAERGSQVQIMRRIYGTATRVLAFLGEAGVEGEKIAKLCQHAQPLVSTTDNDNIIDRTREHFITTGLDLNKKNIAMVDKALANGWDGKNVSEAVSFLSPEDVAQATQDEDQASIEELASDSWQYLVRLLHRPWFRRMWIVQEATLPRNLLICIGPYAMSWEALRYVLCSCPQIVTGGTSRSTYMPFLQLHNARDVFHSSTGDISLAQSLMTFRNFEVTDPLDKIYALLGIVRPALDIVPDYRIPLQSCLQEATLAAINFHGNLDPLCLSLRIGKRMEGLPSWVPDWTDRGPHPRCMVFWQGIELTNPNIHQHDFAATRGSAMAANLVEDNMCLKGHSFDRITQIADKLTGDAMATVEKHFLRTHENDGSDESKWVDPGLAIVSAVRKSIEEIMVWYRLANLTQKGDEDYPFISGQSNKEAFMRTCTLDHPFIGMEKARAGINDWCDLVESSEMKMFMRDQPAPGESKAVHFTHMMQILANVGNRLRPFNIGVEASYYRAFAITERGMFAVVPQDCQVGDEFMLLRGSRVPIVMRKHALLDESWEMLGDAYVHGVMDGEAYDESRCKDVLVV